MHAVAALSLLALAGSVVAAPDKVVYTTEVYTVVVTADGPAPQTYAPAPPAPPKVEKPKVEKPAANVVYVTQEPAKPTVKPTYAPPPQPTYAPAPEPEQPAYTPAPAPAPAPAPPSNSGYMGVVSEWRAKLGLKDLAHDSTLESNAQDTCTSGHGAMVHKMNPGTMGQVLAMGEMDKFYQIFVGGWLCEIPSMPGMDGVCDKPKSEIGSWIYSGDGHAKILTSPDYSKIGCACAEGVCGCDLA